MSSEIRNNSSDLLNFPSDSFLGTLVCSFPSEWQGCFGVLNASSPNPVQNASFWLQQKQTSRQNFQIPPNFSILFDHLTQDFPVVVKNNLYFKPKILLFPLHLQRNVFSFILSKSATIPLELLKNLVKKLDEFKDKLEGWSSTLGKLLKLKIKELEREEDRSLKEERAKFYVDVITADSKERFLSLCEEMKKRNTGIGDEHPTEAKWISLEDEMEEENQDMSPGMTSFLAELCDDDLDLELIEKWEEKENNEKMDIDVAENFQGDILDQKATENDASLAPSPSKKVKMEEKPETIVPPAPGTFEVEHEQSPVTDELITKIAPLESLIQALESSEVVKATTCWEALQIFCELSSLEIEQISNIVKIEDLGDQTIASLSQNFASLDPEPSYMHACAFASYFILPRLQKLEQMASRLLTSAVISFSKKYPKAVCDGLFIRLLTNISFSSSQADIICKTLKDMPNQDASKYLLEILLKALKSSDNKHDWNEDKVLVVQTIIDSKAILDDSLFKDYINVLQENSVAMAKSLKFAKLLLATINNYGTQIVYHKDVMEGILQSNGTFLKKAGLAALKKALAKV